MKMRRVVSYATVAAAAVGVGVAAGISGSSAAPATPKRAVASRALARAVHAEAVIPSRHGFATVTYDRGRVKSVDGNRLTLVEGTAKATYKTVVLTIPAAAVVRNDGAPAALSSLQPGELARVVAGPRKTRVMARHRRSAM